MDKVLFSRVEAADEVMIETTDVTTVDDRTADPAKQQWDTAAGAADARYQAPTVATSFAALRPESPLQQHHLQSASFVRRDNARSVLALMADVKTERHAQTVAAALQTWESESVQAA
uniref:Uncharacterized protein n=1 Tax=Plectus sambesii TaxID=2011161 RepID=A0A914WJT6_9BILA